jgi:hypothetical protein
MTASYPRDPVIALVGEGLRSLLVHCTARRPSLDNREITTFGTKGDRVATYQQDAPNLGQAILRSEFESHFLPADRPTCAQPDPCSHKSPEPLWRTRSELVGRLPRSDWHNADLSPLPGAARIG